MVSRPERPIDILAKQGVETEAMQNTRLNFAADPVYAHLATLSTAGAINGIEWRVEEGRKGKRSLVRVRHREGRRDTKRRGVPKLITHTIDMGDRVGLRGSMNFDKAGASGDTTKRILPYYISHPLTKGGSEWSYPNQLISSEIALLRFPAGVHGTPELKVGILAVHTSKYGSSDKLGIETINETAEPLEFRPIMRLLEQAAGNEFPTGTSGSADLLTRTRPVEARVTNLPAAHFQFHEALGVPSGIVDLARDNFNTIAQYMDLPYSLPSDDA